MSQSTSAFALTFTRQVRPAATALVLVLSLVLAGCLGGDDDGGMLDDGSTNDGTHDGARGDGNATDDDALDESRPFEPETQTWDGVIPTHACVDWNCVASPVPETNDSNTFEVLEGAILASFNFTWERGAPELIIHVGGDSTVEEGEHPDPGPRFSSRCLWMIPELWRYR